MSNKFFESRGMTFWQQGPTYSHTCLERLERSYDDTGKPQEQWTATLCAYTFEDIDYLRDFPECAEVTITYKTQGRLDVFRPEDIALRLSNCKPIRGWFENVTTYFVHKNQTIVPYKLLVGCDVEYLFDARRLDLEEELRIASIKPVTEKPKGFWDTVLG